MDRLTRATRWGGSRVAGGKGGAGGGGGEGGFGGNGSAGGGGPSIGIVEKGTASTKSGLTFTIGTPGEGGSGQIGGATGEKAEMKFIP